MSVAKGPLWPASSWPPGRHHCWQCSWEVLQSYELVSLPSRPLLLAAPSGWLTHAVREWSWVASRAPLLQPFAVEDNMEVCLLPTSTIHSLSFGWSLQPAEQALSLLAHQKFSEPCTVNISSNKKERTTTVPSWLSPSHFQNTTRCCSKGAYSFPSLHSGRLRCKHYNSKVQNM